MDPKQLENTLKTVSTYGLAVMVSIALLGYFIWKDYTFSKAFLDTVSNNTHALESIEEGIAEQAENIQANTEAVKSLQLRLGQ